MLEAHQPDAPETTDSGDAPARGEFRLDDALAPPQRRRLRALPGLIAGAVALVWRAARRELLVTSGLQFVSSVGLGAQLLVTRSLLEHILSGDEKGYAAAVPDIVILAVIIAIIGISNAARSEVQRTLGELVARYATTRVIEISTAVDLLSFDVPAFHDRQQRAVVNASARPVQMTIGLLGVIGGLLSAIGVGVALLAIEPLFQINPPRTATPNPALSTIRLVALGKMLAMAYRKFCASGRETKMRGAAIVGLWLPVSPARATRNCENLTQTFFT